MDPKFIETVINHHDSVIKLVVYWHILRFFNENEEGQLFEVKALESTFGPITHKKFEEVINELAVEKLIKVIKKTTLKDRGVIFDIELTKNIEAIKEKYWGMLKSHSVPYEHYSLDKQEATLKAHLSEKVKKFGKQEVSFDHKDPFTGWGVSNPFFVLLYLEHKEILKIDSIEENGIYIDFDPPVSYLYSYTFNIQMGAHFIRGDNYTVDIKKCEVRFDDGENKIFSNENEAYRLFKLLIQKNGRDVSHKEVTDFVKKDGIPLKEKEELRNYTKALLGRIRKNLLKTSYGESWDIIKNEKGYLHLRGLED